jgi:hypothetical protein
MATTTALGQDRGKQHGCQEPHGNLALHTGPDQAQTLEGDPVIQADFFPGQGQ